jgi:topoisomerase-4 subunit A
MSDDKQQPDLFDLPGGDKPAGTPAPPAENGGEHAVHALAIYRSEGELKQFVDRNFLDYAAYVIRDRAIPDLDDGLKPVQRRILWALYEKDDGRYTKVANIVGHCMQYHPHGDASITDALVTLANKEYLIDKQGNFGNVLTGDPAAAARYIECRLTDLGRTQIFNDKLTRFVPSYDGRNKEPVSLPVKIPLLLMQGADGIAVGLATRILPHNFIELLKAQIAILQEKKFRLLPDFPQGGLMDAKLYDKGRGKVTLRAVIEVKDKTTLVIRQVPFGTTTDSLIASIENAVRKKKLKIKTVQDYTAEKVEIHINLVQGADPEQMVQTLYAFSDCQVDISSNILVIHDHRPVQLTVDEVLHHNTKRLRDLLQRELELEQQRLEDDIHHKSLVQIFVENRLYKAIEKCETYEAVVKAVFDGVNKFRAQLRRDIVQADVEMLLEVRIKRISLFDINQNRRDIDNLLLDLDKVNKNLARLTDFTIDYLQALVDKYAKVFPRRTKTTEVEEVDVRELTATELRMTYDKASGYFGHAVKQGEDLFHCSSLDKVILVWKDGRYKMMPPPDKLFVDKDLLHAAVFDRDQVMTVLFTAEQATYAKKFQFGGAIQNKEYSLIPVPKGKILILEAGEPEKFYLKFKPAKGQRVHQLEFDCKTLEVRGAKTWGNQVTFKGIDSASTKMPRGWEESASAGDDELTLR